ncbi:MAG: AraC family transcriptional regulator [Flavobacteriia bacterium]
MKTIIDLSYMLNGTFGFICAFLVLFSIKSIRYTNMYLAVMIMAISFRLVFRGYLELTGQESLLIQISKNNFYVIILPLPYLYFKNLILQSSSIRRKELFHFIFPLVLIQENRYGWIQTWFHLDLTILIKVLIITLNIVYFSLSIHVLNSNFWRKTGAIKLETTQNKLLKKWTIVVFSAFTLMQIRLITALLINYNHDYFTDNYFIWINSMIMFVVFIMIITSPEILNGYISQISREREVTSSAVTNWQLKSTIKISNKQDLQLSQKINPELNAYFQQIDQFIEKEHFFRQSGLSVNDLALKLKIPKSHLSFIFKYHSTVSFPDFKKLIRIQDAIKLIDDGYLKTNTFDSLSKEVGFSTYNTFYTAFKEVTSKAPQEYVTELI